MGRKWGKKKGERRRDRGRKEKEQGRDKKEKKRSKENKGHGWFILEAAQRAVRRKGTLGYGFEFRS